MPRTVTRRVNSDRRRRSSAACYDAGVLTPEILGRTLAEAPDPELARVAFSRVGDDAAGARRTRPAGDPAGRGPAAGVLDRGGRLPGRHPERGRDARRRRVAVARRSSAPSCADDVAGDGAADGSAPVPAAGDAPGRRARPRRRIARGRRRRDQRVSPTRASRGRASAGRRRRRMAVIGLGKLGGGELNYASDVDLLFVHEDAGPARRTRPSAPPRPDRVRSPSPPPRASRSASTRRCGPAAGPALLSRSLDATLAYYERESATWERQAMIKARSVAGDPSSARRSSRASRRSCTRRTWSPRRSTTSAARRSGWRSTSAGAARSSPRSSAAAAASATWSSRCSSCRSCTGGATRSCAARTRSRALPALADEGYVARGRRRGARRRLPVPAPAGAPAADRPRPADARPAGRPARAHHARALARAWPTPPRCRTSTTARPSSSEGSTSGCSTGRCSRRSPDPAQPSPGADRAGDRGAARRAGVRAAVAVVRGAARLVDPRHADRQGAGARVPGDGAGARAGRRSRRGAGAAGAHRRGGRGCATARPTRWPRDPAAARRLAHVGGGQRVRDRPAGGVDPDRLRALADGGRARVDAQAELVAAVAALRRRASSRPGRPGAALAAVADRVIARRGRRPPSRTCRSPSSAWASSARAS